MLILACGSERWAVKTLADAEAAQIGVMPKVTTVAALRALPAPVYSDGRGREGAELIVWRVDAYVLGAKLEIDGDIHIVISDRMGNTMIAEFPSAQCMEPHSAMQKEATAARLALLRILPWRPVGKYQRAPTPILVRLTGVGFLDKIHGQTGVAPNGVELHPVLQIQLR